MITKLLKQPLHMYQRGDEIMMMTIFPALYRKGGQRWYVVCENSEKLLCSRAGWFQLKNHILNHSFIKPFIYSFMHAHSCLTFGDPSDCSPPGSSVHGLFQARILEWVAILSPASPALVGGVFTTEPRGKPLLSTQLIPVKQLLCINTAFEAFSSQEAENLSRFLSWSNN